MFEAGSPKTSGVEPFKEQVQPHGGGDRSNAGGDRNAFADPLLDGVDEGTPETEPVLPWRWLRGWPGLLSECERESGAASSASVPSDALRDKKSSGAPRPTPSVGAAVPSVGGGPPLPSSVDPAAHSDRDT